MSALQTSRFGQKRQDLILATLASIVTDIIGIDAEQVDADATFLEMGADSLLLLQASQAIQDKTGVRVPFRLLFEELSTLEALAAHIDGELPESQDLQFAIEAKPTAASEIQPPDPPPPFALTDAAAMNASPRTGSSAQSSAFTRMTDQTAIAAHLPLEGDAGSIERIVGLQLHLMSQQLELLRNGQLTFPATPHIQDAPQRKEIVGLDESVQECQEDRQEPASNPTTPAAGIIDPEPYVAYKAIEKNKTRSGLTSRQQAHLDALIRRLTQRTARSKQMAQKYRYRLADSSASAGFRSLWKELCYPISVERASGSRVWDVDGNEYVDITMGFGSLLFGHSPSFVIEAMEEQLSRGFQIGWKTEVAGKVAELVCELTGSERVAFCNSGTEAVMSALRLARAVTGRTKIAVFAGSFHGTFDGVLIKGEKNPDGSLRAVPMAPGVPRHMVENVLVLTHGDPHSLEILEDNVHELAAVLVEPSPSRRPDLQTNDFLQALRRLTKKGGAALIFDEVIIGFRMHPGGGQALFDVEADIITYGKALGSGVPIGAVAGKAAFIDAVDGGMWNYGDASFPQAETTYYAGTFFKHPLVMSAAYAALKRMKESGPDMQQQLNRRTSQFVEGLNSFFRKEELRIQAGNFGSLFRFFYPRDLKHMDLFFFHLIEKGVWVSETRVCFVSTTTTDEDLAYVTKAIKESIAELQEGGFLPSSSRVHGEELSIAEKAESETNVSVQEAHAGAAPADTQQAQQSNAKDVRIAPVTEGQKGLWVLSQMAPETSVAYNESMTVRLRGPLNISSMRKAIQLVVDRHEALRTTFTEEGDYQRIVSEMSVDVTLVDLSQIEAEERKLQLANWLTNEIKQPFDLLEGPLIRVRVARLSDREHLLCLIIHHIVTDAWSFERLLGEINAAYAADRRGISCELPQPMPYSEYARRQANQPNSAKARADEEYWLSRFHGPIVALDLPTDRPRPQLQTYNGARERFRIDSSIYSELKAFSLKRSSTLFMTLLSGFKLLLHNLTSQDDIVVGTHSAGQPNVGGANLVGFCINMLPLRSQLFGNPTFEEYLRSVKRNLLDAYQHQDYPISRLIKKLKLVRDPSRPPLVNVVFNMDWAMSVDRLTSALNGAELAMELVEAPIVFSRFDLLCNVVDVGTELVLDCTYNTDLFDAGTIRDWMADYETLLASVPSRPSIRIDEINEILLRIKCPNPEKRSWNNREYGIQ